VIGLLAVMFFQKPTASAPAAPIPVELKQPDGTRFTAVLKGDEWNSWWESQEGYLILKDESTGWWYYAENIAGTAVKTIYRVGKSDPLKAGILKAEPPVSSGLIYRSQTFGVQPVSPPPVPHTQKVLVILTTFNDQPNTYTGADWALKIFGSSASVKRYYEDISHDPATGLPLLSIVPAREDDSSLGGTPNDGIVGPVTPLYNSGNHPGCIDLSNPTNEACHRELASSVIQAADPYVDFSQFDENRDGIITPSELAIIIVVAGYESATSPCSSVSTRRVWAHRWILPSPLTLDGVSISDYAMFGEQHCWNGGSIVVQATIGVIVHELGHLIIGWPDLYDTSGTTAGIDGAGVMGSGSWGYSPGTYPGQKPVMPTAWSLMWAGLISPAQRTEITYDGTYTVGRWSDNNQRSFAVVQLPTSPDEFFLIEYRYPAGWDEGLLGLTGISSGGVMIYHYDAGVLPGCLSLNDCNTPTKQMLDVEEADGIQDLEAGAGSYLRDADLWKSSGANSFSPVHRDNDSGCFRSRTCCHLHEDKRFWSWITPFP